MFDKMFETIARKQLEDNAVKRINRVLSDAHFRRIGAIVTFPDGTEGLNLVKANAWNMKRNCIMKVVFVGLGLAVGKLGSMKY